MLVPTGRQSPNSYPIYGPMIYTSPYLTFLMRADPLRVQVGGGWALEIATFLGPEMAKSDAISSQGPKKSWLPGPNPSHLPS